MQAYRESLVAGGLLEVNEQLASDANQVCLVGSEHTGEDGYQENPLGLPWLWQKRQREQGNADCQEDADTDRSRDQTGGYRSPAAFLQQASALFFRQMFEFLK